MPIFEYKAIDSDNRVKKGIIDADTPRDARLKLKKDALFVTDIKHQYTLRHRNLDSGQADSGRVIHCLQHVIKQLAEFIVHALHRLRLLSEHRIGESYDIEFSHGADIGGQFDDMDTPAMRVLMDDDEAPPDGKKE